ncbi:DUF1931 family protein [Ramlibacter ginsenosidimutans]|uniref:DUF1931 family protein n=1 Tax=Ramlibacter ginsenosidimutans TaxID=502333 RepID=A0A934WNU8_9BURK|nr:DUF1931 family protein [Ramlibacter ginsenosidimutans]
MRPPRAGAPELAGNGIRRVGAGAVAGRRRASDEFVNRKIHDLLQRGVAIPKANARDVVRPQDVPVTGGLRHCIHEFRALDEDVEVRPILDQLAKLPPLELDFSDEISASLPDLAGELTRGAAGRSCRCRARRSGERGARTGGCLQ